MLQRKVALGGIFRLFGYFLRCLGEAETNTFSISKAPLKQAGRVAMLRPHIVWQHAPSEMHEQAPFGKPQMHVGAGASGIWGAQAGSAKALARNNAPGRSTARATRAWWKHALLSSETL